MKLIAVLEGLFQQLTNWVTPKRFHFPAPEFKLRTWYINVDFIYILTHRENDMTKFKQLYMMDNCRKNMSESANKLIQFIISHSLLVTKMKHLRCG